MLIDHHHLSLFEFGCRSIPRVIVLGRSQSRLNHHHHRHHHHHCTHIFGLAEAVACSNSKTRKELCCQRIKHNATHNDSAPLARPFHEHTRAPSFFFLTFTSPSSPPLRNARHAI